MKTRQFTYKQKSYLTNEEFITYKNKYIEKLNRTKKVVKAEDKTLGDYIKEPFVFSHPNVNQEDFLIEITNSDHMIGTLFTYEDGSQKYASFNSWGPEYTLSGKYKGLVISYFMSQSTKEQKIREILQGWITSEVYNMLMYKQCIDQGDTQEANRWYELFIQHYKSILD